MIFLDNDLLRSLRDFIQGPDGKMQGSTGGGGPLTKSGKDPMTKPLTKFQQKITGPSKTSEPKGAKALKEAAKRDKAYQKAMKAAIKVNAKAHGDKHFGGGAFVNHNLNLAAETSLMNAMFAPSRAEDGTQLMIVRFKLNAPDNAPEPSGPAVSDDEFANTLRGLAEVQDQQVVQHEDTVDGAKYTAESEVTVHADLEAMQAERERLLAAGYVELFFDVPARSARDFIQGPDGKMQGSTPEGGQVGSVGSKTGKDAPSKHNPVLHQDLIKGEFKAAGSQSQQYASIAAAKQESANNVSARMSIPEPVLNAPASQGLGSQRSSDATQLLGTQGAGIGYLYDTSHASVGDVGRMFDLGYQMMGDQAAHGYGDFHERLGRATAAVEKEKVGGYSGKVSAGLANEIIAREMGYTDIDPARGFAAAYTSVWANTAGDHDERAVALQIVAGQTLGGSSKHAESTVGSGKISGARLIAEREAPIMSTYLRASQEATRGYIRNVTGTSTRGTIQLYRGLRTQQSAIKNAAGTGVKIPVSQNPLSSWTSNLTTARGFGNYVLTANVPINSVVGTPFTGMGCLNESELTVSGRADFLATVSY